MASTITSVVVTRQAQAEAFESLGITGDALEALLKETAPKRHEARVSAAIAAAEDWVLETMHLTREDWLTGETLALMALCVLYLDVAGIGGRDGVEGLATLRHPAFSKCGSGRKQARDGGAWSSAIEAAALQLQEGVTPEYLACYSRWVRFRFVADVTDGRAALIGAMGDGSCLAMGTEAWQLTVAREGLRRAVGIAPWFPSVPMDTRPETVESWGLLVNQLTLALSVPTEY